MGFSNEGGWQDGLEGFMDGRLDISPGTRPMRYITCKWKENDWVPWTKKEFGYILMKYNVSKDIFIQRHVYQMMVGIWLCERILTNMKLWFLSFELLILPSSLVAMWFMCLCAWLQMKPILLIFKDATKSHPFTTHHPQKAMKKHCETFNELLFQTACCVFIL